MRALPNFEATHDQVSSPSLTNDDASSKLFNSVMTDFNAKEGVSGKNGSPSESGLLVQDDVPKAFRGASDFEIVDNEIGKSLTRKQPSDEVLSSGNPVGATAETPRHPSKPIDNHRIQNRTDLPEVPSSGKPIGATPETLIRDTGADMPGTKSNHRDVAVTREAKSSGHPAGATAEMGGRGHRGTINHNPAKFFGNKEVKSAGRPAGASAETQLRSSSTGDKRASTDNTKKPDATEEVHSTKKPDGAVPESKLKSQDQNHRSSTSDRSQQNRGVEVEGRKRIERDSRKTEEKLTPDQLGYM